MNKRIHLLSAVATASFFASAAIGADKSGTFTSKVTTAGTQLQITPIGTNGDLVTVYEEDGTSEWTSGVGFGVHKLHCVWTAAWIKNALVEPRGHCIETDQNGDQIVTKITQLTEVSSQERGYRIGEVILGTGRYADMTSSSDAKCAITGALDKYSTLCDVEGSYRIPGH